MKKVNYLPPLFYIILLILSCNKTETHSNLVEDAPYSNPIWHPTGQLLAFNLTPRKAQDSAGFWLINRDGTSMKRTTTFQLLTPCRSPDGNWVAFANGGNIYKMAFDGNSFDTSHIITLVKNGAHNYNPCWALAGDTIYYDSDKNAPTGRGLYAVWKMTSNGNLQQIVTRDIMKGAREPYPISSTQILFTSFIGSSNQVFIMDNTGGNIRQLTFESINSTVQTPRYFNNKLYYESNGIYSINMDGTAKQMLCSYSNLKFSLNKIDGTIAYVNYDYNEIDRITGTIWLMNVTGNNKRSFTFNN